MEANFVKFIWGKACEKCYIKSIPLMAQGIYKSNDKVRKID